MQAIATIASLQDYRSLMELIAEYAKLRCSDDEDLEITIAKSLLPDSYKSNPSMMALKIRERSGLEEFLDSAGNQCPESNLHVILTLMRAKKKNGRYTQAKASVKQVIKDWLDLNEPKWKKLFIPLADIPVFISTHPEQLTYAIKREKQVPIKITRKSTQWIITRK